MNRARHWIRVLLVGAVVASVALRAEAGELTADQRMKILLRVLTYDRNLEARQSGGAIFVGVLFSAKDPASVAEKDEVLAALGALDSLKIKGFTLRFAAIPYTSPAALKTDQAAQRAAALYVCGGLGSAVGAIASFAAESKTATMSGSEAFTKTGLAFAAVPKATGEGGEIIVNLAAADEQGLALDASLLRLAVVLR